MKQNDKVLIIAAAFVALTIGASLKINKEVTPKEVEAAQHLGNYAQYSYSGDYYDGMNLDATGGLNGALRVALTNKIVPKAFFTYSGSDEGELGSVLQTADQDPNNSDNMVYFYTRDSVTKIDSTIKVNGKNVIIWNREHVWPKSLSNGNWEGSSKGTKHAGTDVLHLRPTYPHTNQSRGNTKYGETGHLETETYNDMVWGYKGNDCFEPLDSVKGDVARIIMYVWTAYYGFDGYVSNYITDVFDSYDTLLKWHTLDKPDVLEGNRNNYAQESKQKNRNPFVDHPELAWKIFGNSVTNSQILADCKTAYPKEGYVPNPQEEIHATGVSASPDAVGLIAGQQDQLTASVTPSDAVESVEWSSSNENIATVDQNGKVTVSSSASTGATVNIIARAGSYSATCVVNVVAPSSVQQTEFLLYEDNVVEDDYVIYYAGKAMKAAVDSNRLTYFETTPTNDVITGLNKDVIWHIAKSGSYYTIYNAEENKYAASTGTKNQATLIANGSDDKALWSITKSNGTYEFVNKANSAANINSNLRNNSTYGFACYSTQTGGALSLYKKVTEVIPPEPTIEDTIGELPTNASLSYNYTYEETTGITSDTLNKALTGVTGTSYSTWSDKTSNSSAVYAGQSAGGNDSIQLRTTNSNSGVITTASGGTLKKITVVWGSGNADGRTVEVYGKTSAYSDPTDLYSSNTKGTKIGSIVYGTSTELTVSGNYTYFGIKSSSGALYLSSITVDWEGPTTTYQYSNVAIRFGGLIDEGLWDELDTDEHIIDGFGVMVCDTDTLGNATLKASNAQHDLFVPKSYKAKPSYANDNQKGELEGNYLIWNLRLDIADDYYDKSITAVAYIKTTTGYVYMQSVTTSVQLLALDYINNRGYSATSFNGSLGDLAGV